MSKYGPYAEVLCTTLRAEAVALVVIGGRVGNGAATVVRPGYEAIGHQKLSAVLRALADEMDRTYPPPPCS